MNPAMRDVIERNPEMQRMFQDRQFFAQSAEAFRNPTLMLELLRSSEGALRAMENVPGGFETIKALFKKLEIPVAEAEEAKQAEVDEHGPPTEFNELHFDPNAMAAMFQ